MEKSDKGIRCTRSRGVVYNFRFKGQRKSRWEGVIWIEGDSIIYMLGRKTNRWEYTDSPGWFEEWREGKNVVREDHRGGRQVGKEIQAVKVHGLWKPLGFNSNMGVDSTGNVWAQDSYNSTCFWRITLPAWDKTVSQQMCHQREDLQDVNSSKE